MTASGKLKRKRQLRTASGDSLEAVTASGRDAGKQHTILWCHNYLRQRKKLHKIFIFCLDELCAADPSVAIRPKQAEPGTSAAADPTAAAYIAAADCSATSNHGK